MAAISTLIGIGISAVGAVMQYSQQKKAAKKAEQAAAQQRKSQEAQQRAADFKAARERRAQVAQARVLAAQQQSAGFSSGAYDSSIVSGAVSGIGSQAASNVGASNTLQGYNAVSSNANLAAADLTTQANKYNARAGMYGSIFGAAYDLSQSSIFSSSTSPTTTSVA